MSQTAVAPVAPALVPARASADLATVHRLANGMTLLVEPLGGVRSAAMSLWAPCGVANDPAGGVGAAALLSELTPRGAGARSSRELSDALDRLGIQRDNAAGLYHTRYSAAATAGSLLDALPLYADIVRRPQLSAEDFEASRSLSLQELEGLDDDPRTEALIAIRKQFWPDPLGRNAMGEAADLEAMTLDLVRREHARRFVPDGTILGIAGDVDAGRVIDLVEAAFADWSGAPAAPLAIGPSTPADGFLERETEQTHIAVACDYPREREPEYYVARVAAEVLSGGSSGRLFTEIREVKGLCYSVGTSYASLQDRAALIGYAGTSNDRAQATLDAFLAELRKLGAGVSADEVGRCKVGLVSSTVMSGESTSARAGGIVGDYFVRGRVRSLAEIGAALDAVTFEQVDAFVRGRPLGPYTVVTVGPQRLTVGG